MENLIISFPFKSVLGVKLHTGWFKSVENLRISFPLSQFWGQRTYRVVQKCLRISTCTGWFILLES